MYVLVRDSGAFAGITPYKGERGAITGFDLHWFGAALTVGIALITQIGKQADYLRFVPVQTTANRRRWWAGVLSGEPGWVLLGCAQNAGRRFSGLPGDPAHGAAGKSGRPQPDVFGSARTYLSELRLGRGRNGAVCGDLAAQVQCHQCLCRLAERPCAVRGRRVIQMFGW